MVGTWSLFESIVFVNIINKLADLCIDESVENIHGCFSEIVAFVQSPSCCKIIPNVFGHKSLDQIRGKYQHYVKEKDLFFNVNYDYLTHTHNHNNYYDCHIMPRTFCPVMQINCTTVTIIIIIIE